MRSQSLFKFILTSGQATQNLGKQLGKSLPPGTILLLKGDLGAGKTTFISAIVKELGSFDVVQSPTYALVNEYRTEKGVQIFHFDFYRLKDEQEAFESGLMDLIDSGSWCFIEWPERIPSLLPDQFVKVNITQLNDVRTFTMELTT